MSALSAKLVVPILHSGPGFVVVAKPSGLAVHRNEFSARGSIALLQLVRDQLGHHVNPVHRLDAGTSGCLLFAEDAGTTAMLQRAMTSDRARKTYYAMVRGNVAHKLETPLTISRAIADGKGVRREAVTTFWSPGGCDAEDLPIAAAAASTMSNCNLGSSLVVAQPQTGRWHQIRKHVSGLSHPIINDAKHGDTKVNRWWRQEMALQHLALHCAEMELPLENGEILRVRCPLRAELRDLARQMPWWDDAVAALPLLREEDPWDPSDRAELDARIREADEWAATQRRAVVDRVEAGRTRRSEWGGKRVKTVPGTVVFVEPDALLGAVSVAIAAAISTGGDPGGTEGRMEVGLGLWLTRDAAADVPCEVLSVEVREAPKGESGKYLTVRPLHANLSSLVLDELHVSSLAPLHARFAGAWGRHGSDRDGHDGDGTKTTSTTYDTTTYGTATSTSDQASQGDQGDHGGQAEMRRALVEALLQQQLKFATHLSPSDLFGSFAPGVPLPEELAEC
jgi:tRNA pseudouridine65 synthase